MEIYLSSYVHIKHTQQQQTDRQSNECCVSSEAREKKKKSENQPEIVEIWSMCITSWIWLWRPQADKKTKI